MNESLNDEKKMNKYYSFFTIKSQTNDYAQRQM